jgi:hypothetical protein
MLHAHLLAHGGAGEAELVARAHAAVQAQQLGLDGVGVGLGQVGVSVAQWRCGLGLACGLP